MPTRVPAGFTRAYLKIETGEKIECWFNPKEYTIARTNKWNTQPIRKEKGAGLKAQFAGSDPHKLTIDLLFDDSDVHEGDVRTICDKLLKIMEVNPRFASGDKNNARPPTVEFGWGSVLTFKSVCDSLSIQYTLFKPDGVPIRALVKLQLTQIEKAEVAPSGGGGIKRQNPTTIGIAGLSSHVVQDGDSLPSIAYVAYGDPTRWRAIAEANGIDNPLHLRRGSILSIPRLGI
jgi:nucleoid-associated protein YgaU